VQHSSQRKDRKNHGKGKKGQEKQITEVSYVRKKSVQKGKDEMINQFKFRIKVTNLLVGGGRGVQRKVNEERIQTKNIGRGETRREKGAFTGLS